MSTAHLFAAFALVSALLAVSASPVAGGILAALAILCFELGKERS